MPFGDVHRWESLLKAIATCKSNLLWKHEQFPIIFHGFANSSLSLLNNNFSLNEEKIHPVKRKNNVSVSKTSFITVNCVQDTTEQKREWKRYPSVVINEFFFYSFGSFLRVLLLKDAEEMGKGKYCFFGILVHLMWVSQ